MPLRCCGEEVSKLHTMEILKSLEICTLADHLRKCTYSHPTTGNITPLALKIHSLMCTAVNFLPFVVISSTAQDR